VGAADREEVDVLGAARRLGGEGETLLVVRILIAVDLPALERPAKAISGTCVRGRSRSWLTVEKKRACQSLDMGGERLVEAKKATKEAVRKQSYCTIGSYLSSATTAAGHEHGRCTVHKNYCFNFFRVLE
jgi:hypothetical protein